MISPNLRIHAAAPRAKMPALPEAAKAWIWLNRLWQKLSHNVSDISIQFAKETNFRFLTSWLPRWFQNILPKGKKHHHHNNNKQSFSKQCFQRNDVSFGNVSSIRALFALVLGGAVPLGAVGAKDSSVSWPRAAEKATVGSIKVLPLSEPPSSRASTFKVALLGPASSCIWTCFMSRNLETCGSV